MSCATLSCPLRDGRFGSEVGQFCPKWDKFGTFSDQFSLYFDSESSRFVLFVTNLTIPVDKSDTPSTLLPRQRTGAKLFGFKSSTLVKHWYSPESWVPRVQSTVKTRVAVQWGFTPGTLAHNITTRNVCFANKVGQIDPKCDISGTFSDQISRAN